MDRSQLGLRERKKQRTRNALIDAAFRLFTERGYENTTVADIADAAEVSTRTFFSYFPTREDVIFADTDERLAAMRTALADLPEAASPARAAHQMIERVFATPGAMFGEHQATRNALVLARPELRAKALQRLLTAQREFAEWLRGAHPRIDDVTAGAVSGALIGGLVGAALAGLDRGETPYRIRSHLERVAAMLDNGIGAIDEDRAEPPV
ncbi:MAG: TetR family transcriptional regulator [Pseudonocardiaceae bacterium]